MLKNISNLGKTLNKAAQKTINGGKLPAPKCGTDEDCGVGFDYTDPITGHRTCYNVSCGTDGQCHMVICG